MKHILAIVLILLLIIVLDARAQAGTLDGKKILVAYFSWSGNTETIAKMISNNTGGDLFKVTTSKAYPENYKRRTEMAKEEQNNNARPELSTHVQDMAQYDVIFLGYPSWWGTLPMAMFTFLEEYDLSGKTIIPFCTNEGSGLGRGPSDIAKLAPNSTLIKGLSVRGGSVGGAQSDVENWLNGI